MPTAAQDAYVADTLGVDPASYSGDATSNNADNQSRTDQGSGGQTADEQSGSDQGCSSQNTADQDGANQASSTLSVGDQGSSDQVGIGQSGNDQSSSGQNAGNQNDTDQGSNEDNGLSNATQEQPDPLFRDPPPGPSGRCGPDGMGCELVIEVDGTRGAVVDCGYGTCPTCPPGYGNLVVKYWCLYRCVDGTDAIVFHLPLGLTKVLHPV